MKRVRSLRTTPMQYEELIKYMESHTEFAASKYLTKEGKKHNTEQWEELHKMLNVLSSGPEKTVKQWQTVWRDLKSNASKRASNLRNERNRTGNFPVKTELLNDMERRIIFCIGLEYVQGTSDCPDSTPEEEEYQIQLENGNEDILGNSPTTSSIADVLEEHVEITENNDEELTYTDALRCLRSEETQRASENSQRAPTRSQQTRREILQNRRNRQRIGMQLQEARDKFAEIAENHTIALRLQAEASMKLADSTLLAAQNEERRLQIEERRLTIEERRIAVDEQQIKLLDNLQKIVDRLL